MIKQFESIARKMQEDFERTRDVPHHGVKGTVREMLVVTDFLRAWVPQKYSVGSGLIMDENANYSRQQDIVIYDGFNLPVVEDFDSTKVLFSEQCLAAIEVKSSLDNSEVDDILEKANSIWELKRATKYRLLVSDGGAAHDHDPRIMLLGLVFDSKLSLEQIRDRLQAKKVAGELRENLSAILVLSDKNREAGLVGYVNGAEIGQLRAVPDKFSLIASVSAQSQGHALFMFYLQLMQAVQLAESVSMAPDYLAYAKNAGLGTINIAVSPSEFQKSHYKEALDVVLHAHEHPSTKVLLAYWEINRLTEKVGVENAHLIPGSQFSLGGNLVSNPTPMEVWSALENLVADDLQESDKLPLSQLLTMLHWMSQNLEKDGGHISIVVPSGPNDTGINRS